MITSLIAQLRGTEQRPGERGGSRLFQRPTRNDVLQGFRLILGRELDDETTIREHMRLPNVDVLRRAILSSEEFREKYKGIYPEVWSHPDANAARDTVVFIHLRKTGGISLRVTLESQFAENRRCPLREDHLHRLSVAELGWYDFYSGHFRMSSIRFIPRNHIRTLVLFREPRARLISLYRFLRSHSTQNEFANDLLINIANECTAEEFFERPEVRSSVAVDNNYLATLGELADLDPRFDLHAKENRLRGIERAKLEIRSLTALGITEQFNESVDYVCKALSLALPNSIQTVNVTDTFPETGASLRRVEQVPMTPRLAAALEDLTVYDQELYGFAAQELRARRSALGTEGTQGVYHQKPAG